MNTINQDRIAAWISIKEDVGVALMDQVFKAFDSSPLYQIRAKLDIKAPLGLRSKLIKEIQRL